MQVPLGSWIRRASAIVLVPVATVVALVAGLFAAYWLCRWITSPAALASATVVTFAAMAWGGMSLSLKTWGAKRAARRAIAPAAVMGLVVAVVLYAVILRPNRVSAATRRIPSNTKYWDLPTGSRLAYWEYDPPSDVPVRAEPIVYLHGGPGMFVGDIDREFYGQFAAQGYKVYLYDQAGCGQSQELSHLGQYSVARSVDDLEAIRRQLDVPRMILIGHSWGSTLAAQYMARFPDRVAKAIFHSPARFWRWTEWDSDYDRTAAAVPDMLPLRVFAAYFLFTRNPDAAEQLLPRAEAGQLYGRILLDPGVLLCRGASRDTPAIHALVESASLNFYDNVGIAVDLEDPSNDPRPKLRDNKTPSIVLYAECDFLPWRVPLEYRATLPDVRVFYVPGAGHLIQLSQPEKMAAIVRAFLLDEEAPIAPYSGDADPRPSVSR